MWYIYSYYQLEDPTQDHMNQFLTKIIDKSLKELQDSYCIEFEEVSTVYHYTCTCD